MKLTSAAGFSRRLGVGLRAGADLIPLLRSEAKQGSSRQRAAVTALAENAKQGVALSETMRGHGRFFPPLLITMTRVGEETGRMERALLSLADHYDNQVTLRRSFYSSIALPLLQLAAGMGVVSLMIWLQGILTPATGGEMADMLGLGLRGTKGVLTFWMYLAVIVAIVLACIWAFRRNLGGVQNLVPLLYMIPVLGPSLQTITLARFCWTLSLTLDAGLDPIRGVGLALDATDSDYYRAGAEKSETAIRGGATLADALRAADVFPEDFLGRVEAAELSGTDAESIGGLAREYDDRARLAMSALAKLASGLVWITMLVVMLFFIIRLIMNVLGAYSSALEGI